MVDILILNYNDAETTIELLKYVMNYSNVGTICIVDNNSTDDSVEKLSKYNSERVIVVNSGKNGGYGYGNNFGIKYLKEKCDSKYILLCNPDVIIEEKVITELECFLNCNKDYMIVAPFMLNKEGKKQSNSAFPIESCKKYILSTGLICSKLFQYEKYPNLERITDDYLDVGAVAGSLFMFDVEKMINHGMYDERVFLYCEERILAMKCHKAGYKIALLPKSSYVHNHSVSINKTLKSERAKRKLMNRSRMHVIKEYYNASWFEVLMANIIFSVSLAEITILSLVRKVK